MFEAQLALEKAQGYRGLATRLFAPISTLVEAELLIRETCLTLLGIAGLFALAGVRFGILNFVLAAGLGPPALLALLTRARAATVFLCICVAVTSFLYVVGGAHGFWVIVMPFLLCGFAVRASQAAFKRCLFLARAAAAAPPVAFPPHETPAG